MIRVLFAAATLAAGCASEFVVRRPRRQGPVPEVGYVDTGGGDLRYSVEGWSWVVGARRSSALRRMKRLCKGLTPSIIDEYTHEDVDAAYAGAELADGMAQGMDHYNVAPYRHIVFECVPKAQTQSKLVEK